MPAENKSTPSYPVITQKVPTFYFIGVTTGKSSIMKVFPLWMKEIGKEEIVMQGIDLKIHDQPEAYLKLNMTRCHWVRW